MKFLLLLAFIFPIAAFQAFKPKEWEPRIVSPLENESVSQAPNNTIRVWGTFHLDKSGDVVMTKSQERAISKAKNSGGILAAILDFFKGKPKLDGTITCNGVKGIIHNVRNYENWEVLNVPVLVGNNTVRCTYKDKKVETHDIVNFNYNLTNSAPIAQIIPSTTSGIAPFTVTFDGSQSSDSDGEIASYRWEFPDGTSATGATASYTFLAGGVFDVDLIATDNIGAQSSTHVTINVIQDTNPPTISFLDADGTIFTTTTPYIEIDFDDQEGNINQGSFTLMLDGTNISSRVVFLGSKAQLQFSAEFPLPRGEHVFTARISDLSGNQASSEVVYTVDDGLVTKEAYLVGRVVDKDNNPIKGAIAKVNDGPVGKHFSAVSDSEGYYRLPFESSGLYTLKISREAYTVSTKQAEAIEGVDGSVPEAVLMLADTQITTITPTGGFASNASGTVSVSVPAGAVSENISLSMTEANFGRGLEIPLPPLTEYTYAIVHEPAGTVFNQPVTFSTVNDLGFPPNYQIALGITDDVLGIWTDAGSYATVSADGSKVVYELSHFSSSDANNGGLTPGIPPDLRPPQDPPCPTCLAPLVGGSVIHASKGDLGIRLELPKIRRMERELGLTFHYSSTTAYPTVLLEALNSQDHPRSKLPQRMRAKFSFRARTFEPEFVPETNLGPSFFRVRAESKNVNGEFLRTGAHDYELTATADYPGVYGDTPYFGAPAVPAKAAAVDMRAPLELKSLFSHRVIVQNEIASSFGAGWTLEGLERLYEDPQGTIVHVAGINGGQVFSPIPSVGLNEDNKLNDVEYTDVLSYRGFVYASSCSANAIYRISLTGEANKIAELNCPSRLSPSRKGGLYVVTNNGQDITFLPLNNKGVKKVIAKTNDPDPITSIFEDSVLAVHFSQGPRIKTVSPKNGEILKMIGSDGIIQAEFVMPMDITMDKYGSFIVLDSGQNKVIQIFPKSRTVRTILSATSENESEAEKLKKSHAPELNRPIRLSYDQNLKRYFILEESGRILHWKGVGFDELDQIGMGPQGFEHIFGKKLPKKNKTNIKALAVSPELGLVYIDETGLTIGKIDQLEKVVAARSYISPKGEFSKLSRFEDGTYEMISVDKERRIFDAQGRLTATIETDGKTTSYNYQNNLLTSIVTISGDSYTFNYNGDAKLSSVTDPAGRVTTFAISAEGNLTDVTFSDSTSHQYSYNNLHLMTSETDPEGKATAYLYKQGRIKTEIYPGSRVRQIVPLSEVGIANESMKKGVPAPVVAPKDMKARFTSPEGREMQLLLGRSNTEVGRIDGNGKISYTERGSQALPLKSISPEGRVTQRWFDSFGRLAYLRDADGQTFFQFDPVTQKPSRIDRNEFYPELFTYYPSGLLKTKTDRKGNVTTLNYFSNGVISSITNSVNDSIVFTIDSKGNITSHKDSLNNKTELTLDSAGFVISSKDPKGQVTNIERDDWNRVTSITSPINGVTSFTYSPKGLLLTVTDARNQTTSYTYNEQDLVATETNEVGLTKLFTYDQDGLLTQETTWSGQNIIYEYDLAERLIKRTSPDDETIFTRDGDGFPISISNNDSLIEQDFDRLGRLISSWQKGVTNTPVRYKYAEDGTVASLRFGSRLEERYIVDENDMRVGTNINHYGFIQSWQQSRDILSRPRVLTYPNGLTSTKNYGANSWISSISHSTGSFGINFSFDENGNITGIAENGLLGPKSNNYVYDGENRLNSVTGSNPEVFNMDILGNILNGNAVFNNRNQLTENAEWFFEYDLNGNLSKKSSKLSPKVLEYDFDLENRLKQVRIFENGTVLSTRLSYRYDALGRRIERKVEGAQTKITQFVHDGQDVLLEQNQFGQLERTYIRGSGIDELYGVLEDINQNGSIGASEAFYFRTDHLGSVREVVKSSGETKQSVMYSAYGEPVVTPAAGEVELNVSRLYTGRDYERETGDYYYRARWFNSQVATFLSPDPIEFFSGDSNFYRYTGNNSLKYSDPFGLYEYTPKAGGPINDHMKGSMSCMDECMGQNLVISGAKELGHGGGATGPHGSGNACDLSKSKNNLNRNVLKSCFEQCFDAGTSYAQEEKDHYHIQWGPGKGGAAGFAPGVK